MRVGGGGGLHIMVSNRVRVSEPRRTLPLEISRSTTPPGPSWTGPAQPGPAREDRYQGHMLTVKYFTGFSPFC